MQDSRRGIATPKADMDIIRARLNRLGYDIETMALLKLLALGKKEFNEGKFSDAEAFLDEMED